MNKTKSLPIRLFNALIDIISVLVFPFIFASHYKIEPMTGYIFVIVFISLIFIYKDVFIPRRPNKYFDMLFFGIFLILSFIFSFQLNALITIISIFQLLLFILAKIIKNSAPLLTELIFGFITPVFLMVILTFSLTKFLSFQLLVLILLINIFALTSNFLEANKSSIFGMVIILFLCVVMYLANYVEMYNAVSMFATLLVFVLLKYYTNITVKSGWARVFLSLMQLF